MTSVLYISYDGMLEPLGQSQVLAYLEQLSKNVEIHLISFEKIEDWKKKKLRQAVQARIRQAGIIWHPLRYHRNPSVLATAYDIACGIAVGTGVALRHRIDIIHARSYVAAAMTLAIKIFTRAKFLFDMRGFWADERIDGGIWRRGSLVYRITKGLERRFLQSADHVVTLTKASEREIVRFPYLQNRMPPLSVIPTCADLERFCLNGEGPKGPFTLGHVGSTGTWYLFPETLAFFKTIEQFHPDALLLVVSRDPHDAIRAAAKRAGIADAKLDLVAADHRDIPKYLARMHAAAAIIKPVYSKIASAPTKLAEYLGCGVPCVGNVGVGDMQTIIEGEGVGVLLTDFSDADRQAAAKKLFLLLAEPGLRQRCAAAAKRLFSLETGVLAYLQIYQRLASLSPSVNNDEGIP